MCTAIHLSKERLFGRTLDYERSFGEGIIMTPREHITLGESKNRYAMLGVGVVEKGCVLYYDGLNEWGLSGGALSFPGYAVYHDSGDGKAVISSSALLSFMLGFCKSICEVKDVLKNTLVGSAPVGELPSAPLHWIFADATGAITVESTSEGLQVSDNPFGVLTNSPKFDYQVTRLADYMSLRADCPENRLKSYPLKPYSRGLGAMGLPGDFSSSSRFARAFFIKENTISPEGDGLQKMMSILSSMTVPRGCVITEEGRAVSTLYTSVSDMENLTYYFCSHNNRTLRSVKLYPEQTEFSVFPLYEKGQILQMN